MNGTLLPPVSSPSPSAMRTVEFLLMVYYIAVFVVGLFGNILIVIAVSRYKELKTVVNIFLANLAISDTLFVLLSLFDGTQFILHRWIFGDVVCRLQSTAIEVSYTVSVVTLATVAVERYLCICCPYRRKRTVRQSVHVGVGIWLFAISFCTVLMWGYHSNDDSVDGTSLCRNDNWSKESRFIFYVIHSVIVYLLPLLILALSHYKISKVLSLQKKRCRERISNRQNGKNVSTNNISGNYVSTNNISGNYVSNDVSTNNLNNSVNDMLECNDDNIKNNDSKNDVKNNDNQANLTTADVNTDDVNNDTRDKFDTSNKGDGSDVNNCRDPNNVSNEMSDVKNGTRLPDNANNVSSEVANTNKKTTTSDEGKSLAQETNPKGTPHVNKNNFTKRRRNSSTEQSDGFSTVALDMTTSMRGATKSQTAIVKQYRSLRVLTRRSNVIGLLLTITSIFVVLWTPFIVVRLLMYADVEFNIFIFRASQLLFFTNTAVNFVVYALMSTSFRRAFKGLFRCGGGGRRGGGGEGWWWSCSKSCDVGDVLKKSFSISRNLPKEEMRLTQ